jgi:uncharacterized membrane protein AbrB (regulator of aidB expression)
MGVIMSEDFMTSVFGALILGAALRQTLRLQATLLEFSINMAGAENNTRKPIEYQNMMTPRWLVAFYFLLIGALIYLAIKDFHAIGVTSAVSDVLAFFGGFLLSATFSNLTQLPSSKTYAAFALQTLTNREADFRRAKDLENMKTASHFRWLLSTLSGMQ